MKPVTVELSRPAAVFLVGTVRHMNQIKILPDDNRAALQTSAWLEEIEAVFTAALTPVTDTAPPLSVASPPLPLVGAAGTPSESDAERRCDWLADADREEQER